MTPARVTASLGNAPRPAPCMTRLEYVKGTVTDMCGFGRWIWQLCETGFQVKHAMAVIHRWDEPFIRRCSNEQSS